MIKHATYNPDLSSPHLYRPRSTSIHYPPAPSPFRTLLHTLTPRRPLRSYITLTTLLLPLWLLLFLHSEHWIYTSTASTCRWDDWEHWPPHATPHRVALIADPQLIDIHTYARRGPSLWATIFYSDRYLSRTWQTLHQVLTPQTVFFLGDLFDGGREWSVDSYHKKSDPAISPDPRAKSDWKKYGHAYWLNEFRRFEKIFPTPPGVRSLRNLPGNHDLGYALGVRKEVRDRFEAFFGKSNGLTEVGNHTFISIDAVSLANENDPEIYTPGADFLSSLSLLNLAFSNLNASILLS